MNALKKNRRVKYLSILLLVVVLLAAILVVVARPLFCSPPNPKLLIEKPREGKTVRGSTVEIEVKSENIEASSRIEVYLDEARLAEMRGFYFKARVPIEGAGEHRVSAVAFDRNEGRIAIDQVYFEYSSGGIDIDWGDCFFSPCD